MSSMEVISSPPWMNDSFLVQVLQSVDESEDAVEVVKWSCEAALPPGSNYLSVLYRLYVDYKSGHTSDVRSITLIVKAPLESGLVKEFMEANNGYGRELQMYKEVLPKMYKLAPWQMTARAFQCPRDNTLVLEDLRAQGYKMADRIKQLDPAHCRQFLISLARLHALSVALHQREPAFVEAIGKHMMFSPDPEGREKHESFMKFNLNAMLSTLDKMEECKRYSKMIRKKMDRLYDELVQVFQPSDGLNVLNHGDTWTSNILFKYNKSGDIIDTKIVDFQMTMYCSFAHDIILFWWTSANEDAREHHREEMFEIYRHTLNQSLETLECSVRLSKEGFESEIKNCASFSIQVVAGMLSLVMADPDNLIHFNDLDENAFNSEIQDFENSPQTNNYRSKFYKAVLPNVLRQIEEFGAFT